MGAAISEFQVPEIVRFDNAAAARLAGELFVDQGPAEIQVSLAPLRKSNSVVVAMLLAWVRHARARNKTLRFVDVPGDLRNIIELYGVAGILPLEDGSSAGVWSVADDEAETRTGDAGQPEDK